MLVPIPGAIEGPYRRVDLSKGLGIEGPTPLILAGRPVDLPADIRREVIFKKGETGEELLLGAKWAEQYMPSEVV
jgi:hypothetical protein